MKFHKQLGGNSCQIVALQTVLSFYELYPTFKQIKSGLPKHSYGNSIDELAGYLDSKGIKTRLVTNDQVIEEDIGDKPVIINVDWYKIRNTENKCSPHYVVAAREGDSLMFYDGSNYSRKVKTSFAFLLNASKEINRFGHDGRWLFCLSPASPLQKLLL